VNIRLFFFVFAVFFSSFSSAQEKKLFQASSFLTANQERKELRQSEREMLDTVRSMKEIKWSSLVHMDASALDGDVLSFEIPGKKKQLLKKRLRKSANDQDAWLAPEASADVPDHPRGRMIFGVKKREEGRLFGEIILEDGSTYALRHVRDSLYLLMRYDISGIPDHAPPTDPPATKASKKGKVGASPSRQGDFSGTLTIEDAPTHKAGDTAIDILFVFSPGAISVLGNTPEFLISERVSQANLVFTNSGIPGSVRSAGWVVHSREPTSVFNAVSDAITADGIRREKAARRADLAVLIGRFSDARGGTSVGNFQWDAVGVAVDAFAFNTAQTNTFAHELGHVLGADHDPAFLSLERKTPTFPTGRGYIIIDPALANLTQAAYRTGS
jgi:hypothetical protein